MNINHPRIIIIILTLLISGLTVFTQTKDENFVGFVTTEFTYQGKLSANGATANGNYDFEFKLTDANGAVLGTLQRFNVAVANGIFTVRLDYGFAPFNSLENRFLEIGVRSATVAAVPFSVLSPRQPLTASPYAIISSRALNSNFAGSSADSQKLGGVEANQYVLTSDTRLSDARQPLAGSNDYIQNTTNQQNANFNVAGGGTVGGAFSADSVNSVTDYSIGSNRVLAVDGTSNLFAGVGAGQSNTAGAGNSFFGNNSGFSNTTGIKNSFFGNSSGLNNSTGSNNTFVGFAAGAANTNRSGNSFFGANAGNSNSGGDDNSFFGFNAGLGNANGARNSFFGVNSGMTNIGGFNNSFFGVDSGKSNTTGNGNAFFGLQAGRDNLDGSNNSFFGLSAGFQNTSGTQNAFFGTSSGGANLTGSNNSFFGYSAGEKSTANGSTFLGAEAGKDNTSGSKNTFVGYLAGAGNFTGSSNSALGASASVFGNVSFATAIGSEAIVSTNNTILLGRQTGDDRVLIPGNADVRGKIILGLPGNAGGSSLCRNGNNEIAFCSSSIRYKKDVENFTPGLSLIKKLRPVSFTWKTGGMRDLGFVAEEVAAVEPLLTTVNEKGETEGVKYDRISAVLVNAVGEQQTEIENQQSQIKQQQTEIEEQARQLKLLQQQIEALKKLACSQNARAEICTEKEPEK